MEFIVHVENEYDYRFICVERDELFDALKECWFNIMNANLPIYGVPGKLKEYATSKKDVKANNQRTPPDSYKLEDENIYEPVEMKISGSSTEEPLTLDKNDLLSPGMVHRTTYVKQGGDKNATLNDFQIKRVIGRGSFGKVFLVIHKSSGEVYAMKSLRKDVILDSDQVESTKLEKDILMEADHPFLVGMSYVFQSEQKIFFVMRFVRGGELFTHLRQVTRFTEERAKFYTM